MAYYVGKISRSKWQEKLSHHFSNRESINQNK